MSRQSALNAAIVMYGVLLVVGVGAPLLLIAGQHAAGASSLLPHSNNIEVVRAVDGATAIAAAASVTH